MVMPCRASVMTKRFVALSSRDVFRGKTRLVGWAASDPGARVGHTLKSDLNGGRQKPRDRARKLLRMRYLSENPIRAHYARHPGFPEAAADYCLPEHAGNVLDLGAGTGKFTELLTQRAEHVTAVDPSISMLAQLRRKLDSVTVLGGMAEGIPLPDCSQDAVTVAQAFHRFDPDKACQEISRVLRPGGTLALLWNGPGPGCAWDTACQSIAHPDLPRLNPSDAAAPAFEAMPGFEGVRSAWIPWSEQITRADYIRRWLTVSTFIAADDDTRTEMIDGVYAGRYCARCKATLCVLNSVRSVA